MKLISTNRLLLSTFFVVIIALSAFDLITDFQSQTSVPHLLIEGVILLTSALFFISIWARAIRYKRQNVELGTQLASSQNEINHWKKQNQEILRGLSEAIDEQFQKWRLTPAEKEVGLLLLKGLGLKEIAALRDVSERTVRQQAIEIYKKSNLNGRAEFAAFFLDDLMLPLSIS